MFGSKRIWLDESAFQDKSKLHLAHHEDLFHDFNITAHSSWFDKSYEWTGKFLAEKYDKNMIK